MKANIRKATIADYDALCELFDEADRLHRNNLPDIFQKPKGPVREKDYYREIITDENIALFVAEMDKTIIDYIHAIVRDTLAVPVFVPRRYVIIDNIAVQSDFQKYGIGKRLMTTIHEWAISNGATTIELNVYEFNKGAIAFYKKLGYETFSRRMSKGLN